MSIVTLVSGGLDSTLMAFLTKEQGIEQFPLFIDYGQRSRDREFKACRSALKNYKLPTPSVADLSGYGKLVRSGLTDSSLPVMEAAFTPGRNLLFLLMGASYGYTVGADGIAIGLLSEKTILFPDQTDVFLRQAEKLISRAVGKPMNVVAPLRNFYKKDIVRLAKEKGISGTYSCHAGRVKPCGICVSCREFDFDGE